MMMKIILFNQLLTLDFFTFYFFLVYSSLLILFGLVGVKKTKKLEKKI